MHGSYRFDSAAEPRCCELPDPALRRSPLADPTIGGSRPVTALPVCEACGARPACLAAVLRRDHFARPECNAALVASPRKPISRHAQLYNQVAAVLPHLVAPFTSDDAARQLAAAGRRIELDTVRGELSYFAARGQIERCGRIRSPDGKFRSLWRTVQQPAAAGCAAGGNHDQES